MTTPTQTFYPKLSPHFGGEECVAGARKRTNAGTLRDPGPLPPLIEARMRALAVRILEPWRSQVGAIRINRWWANEELNTAQGGVSNSQHLYGEAADCVPIQMGGAGGGVGELQLAFEKLVHNKDVIPTFDQAIFYPHRGFIHVSLKSDRAEDNYRPASPNREQALFSSARNSQDSKRYFPYDDYALYLSLGRDAFLSRRKA